MPPRSISDEFNDSYAEQGQQPSTGRREVIKHTRVEYVTQAKDGGATALRVGGAGLKRGGQAMKTTGNKMMKAGAAMSRTGAGAVVGVPLMAVGGAMHAGGRATRTTGTTMSTSGRTMRRRLQKPALSIPDVGALKDKVKATRVTIMIASWGMPLWFGLQLPLALITTVFFGVTANAVGAIEYVKNLSVFAPHRTVYAGVNWVSQNVFGVNLDGYFDPSVVAEQLAGGFLEMLSFAVFFIGLGTLFTMIMVYILSGIKCFFGEGAALKISAFIFAVFGYFMPFLNIFPWFIFWALAVWRYPK
jgi:hypothetical protein